ncbi:hypothetical protein Nmel_011058 [Mimus melanotis]
MVCLDPGVMELGSDAPGSAANKSKLLTRECVWSKLCDGGNKEFTRSWPLYCSCSIKQGF